MSDLSFEDDSHLRTLYPPPIPNLVTYNAAIAACARVKGNIDNIKRNQEIAVALLHQMKELDKCISSSTTSKSTSSKLFKSLSSLIECDTHFKPDIITYTSLMEVMALNGDYEKCEDILKEILAKKLKPNVFTFNSLIKAYGKAYKIEEAIEVINRMENLPTIYSVQPDLTT